MVKQMLVDGCESALMMEDDVDVEWDLERVWSRIRRRLPVASGRDGEEDEWDVSFLGHCWGRELLSESTCVSVSPTSRR